MLNHFGEVRQLFTINTFGRKAATRQNVGLFGRIGEASQLLTIYAIGLVTATLSWLIGIFRRGHVIRNALRSRRKGLQTAVVTYNHPDKYKRVVLVGAVHVSDRPYFEQLKELVDLEHEANDSVILYEGVRKSPPPQDDDKSATAVMQRAFGNLGKLYTYISACTGKAFQPDVLTEEDHWINTDMTQREVAEKSAETWIISFLAKTRLLHLATKLFGLMDIPEPPDKPNFMMSMQVDNGNRAQHLSTLLTKPFGLLPKKATPAYVILHQRNELAVKMILRQTMEYDNIVSIWGAAHLPGMGRLLEKNGYIRSKKIEWYTSHRYRRYGLLSILWYVLSGRFKTA